MNSAWPCSIVNHCNFDESLLFPLSFNSFSSLPHNVNKLTSLFLVVKMQMWATRAFHIYWRKLLLKTVQSNSLMFCTLEYTCTVCNIVVETETHFYHIINLETGQNMDNRHISLTEADLLHVLKESRLVRLSMQVSGDIRVNHKLRTQRFCSHWKSGTNCLWFVQHVVIPTLQIQLLYQWTYNLKYDPPASVLDIQGQCVNLHLFLFSHEMYSFCSDLLPL